MNRIARRSFAVIVLTILLAGGFIFFLVEYFINAPTWAVHVGSAHAYNGDQFQSGVVTDRDGELLLDMEGQWTYAEDVDVRKSTLHWVGDREGNILIPAVPNYYEEVVGYSYINGLYTYGGIGNDSGTVLPLSALFGGAFVTLADLAARLAFSPYELPVGIFLSVLGGPFFLWLLYRRKGGKSGD